MNTNVNSSVRTISGNFHGVIAQSGSEMAPWAVIKHWEHAWNNSKKFADKVGCPTYTSELLVSCLRFGRSDIELGDASEFQVC